MKNHLDYLAGLPDKQDYLVLTHLPAAVRMLGFNESLPWYEPFGEVLRPADLDALVTYIDDRGPRHVVVEDPRTVQSQQLPNIVEHQQAIIERLGNYVFEKAEEGWLVYGRR